MLISLRKRLYKLSDLVLMCAAPLAAESVDRLLVARHCDSAST